jgi:hypothetical protein
VTLFQQYTLAVFHETLRFFPPVPQLAKPVKSDAVLKIKRFTQHSAGPNKLVNPEEVEMKVPARSIMVVDILGAQMNRMTDFLPMCKPFSYSFAALHWGEDVEEFKPERFIDTDTYRWPRDACTSTSQSFSSLVSAAVECELDETFCSTSPRIFCRPKKLHRSTLCTDGECMHFGSYRSPIRDSCSARVAVANSRREEKADAQMASASNYDAYQRPRAIPSSFMK